MSYVIRDAVPADLPAIRDIYNDAVLNTLAIWNEQTVDLDNRQHWFNARQAQGYPILVIVDDADIALGYASFGDWRPFEGFRHTVEHSVYVHPEQRGKHLGPQLLAERRLARGVKLNYPETIAFISAALLEGARDGRTVAELMHYGTTLLSREQVMEGIPEMIPDIQVEATFPDGTKLVTVHQPIA